MRAPNVAAKMTASLFLIESVAAEASVAPAVEVELLELFEVPEIVLETVPFLASEIPSTNHQCCVAGSMYISSSTCVALATVTREKDS